MTNSNFGVNYTFKHLIVEKNECQKQKQWVKTFMNLKSKIHNSCERKNLPLFFSNQSVNSKHIHDMKWLVNEFRYINIVHEQTESKRF